MFNKPKTKGLRKKSNSAIVGAGLACIADPNNILPGM